MFSHCSYYYYSVQDGNDIASLMTLERNKTQAYLEMSNKSLSSQAVENRPFVYFHRNG
jgi:hypothetical protein